MLFGPAESDLFRFGRIFWSLARPEGLGAEFPFLGRVEFTERRGRTDGAGHGGAERSRSEAEAEWSGTVSGAISRSSENHGGSGQSAEDRPIDSGSSRRPANHPGTLFLVGLVDIAVLDTVLSSIGQPGAIVFERLQFYAFSFVNNTECTKTFEVQTNG